MHLRHTLELRPRFQPAQDALRQMEAAPATQLHGNTVFIIIVLVSQYCRTHGNENQVGARRHVAFYDAISRHVRSLLPVS